MFVDGDFFWYPVQGEPSTVAAPDVTVIDQLVSPIDVTTMGSYRQWIFGGRVLLAIEVLSPSNTWAEMARKLTFYQRHGVQEYWVFDPADGALEVHVREGGELRKLGDRGGGLISATTGVHVHVEGKELVVADPDGRRWLAPEDEAARADELAARADALATEVATLRQRLGDVGPLPD
jgi:Uma2 family endonuclease